MRFRVLACDYDGTIATRGVCAETTRAALRRVAESGRRLILVTGRTLEEITAVFDDFELFDAIIMENGAVLATNPGAPQTLLAPPVPGALIEELRRRAVSPLVVGRVICSIGWGHAATLRQVIDELGLDIDVTRNRDTAMAQPPGINKATGLAAALSLLGIEARECVAVGDGENDVALLDAAGTAIAVADAVGELKEHADVVLQEPDGAGVVSLAAALLSDDLAELRTPTRIAG